MLRCNSWIDAEIPDIEALERVANSLAGKLKGDASLDADGKKGLQEAITEITDEVVRLGGTVRKPRSARRNESLAPAPMINTNDIVVPVVAPDISLLGGVGDPDITALDGEKKTLAFEMLMHTFGTAAHLKKKPKDVEQ